MFGAVIVALLIYFLKQNTNKSMSAFVPFTLLQFSNTNLISAANLNLFLIFLKIGAILYGSGYVLFAFLDAELVATGLLSRTQLIDAIAVGQFTPGPVFSSVTFIGYQINGFSGALISTIAIFLPSFIFVGLLNPLVKKMRNSNVFSTFLDAVNVASIAIIISICIEMGKETIVDWRTILIAILSIIITFNYRKINSAFIVLGGSLIGYLLHFL
jgi:chromate transporter